MINIFFDENIPIHISNGISELNKGLNNSAQVLTIVNEFGRGTKDEEWIPKIAKIKGIVLTQDKHIFITRKQKELLREYRLSVILLQPPKKGFKYWQLVEFIVRKWTDIIEKVNNEKISHPFLLTVTPRKIEREIIN